MKKIIDKINNVPVPNPPKCDSCRQPIWNVAYWDMDMCGPCVTGESAELFPENWIPPVYGMVDTDKKFLIYWKEWMRDVWIPEAKKDSDCVDEHPELFGEALPMEEVFSADDFESQTQ